MNYHQDDWVDWFFLVEFVVNDAVFEYIGVFPFFTNYGFNPRLEVEPSAPYSLNLTTV